MWWPLRDIGPAGPLEVVVLSGAGWPGAATPPSTPSACYFVNALTCGFAHYLLSRVRMARIQKSTPNNFFMRSDLQKGINAKKERK